MKILHTADVHLQEDKDETIEALEAVLERAAEEDVDLLTIGGDLFDSAEDAEALRPQLRDLFSDNPFDILAIPGNHDAAVYRDNLQFGNDLTILTEEPYEQVEYDDVDLVGVPFQEEMDEELFGELQNGEDDRERILLLHCTLDIGFGAGGAGEGEARYFPVTAATLADLGYDYVLAGHIHSTDRVKGLDNGGTFVYPGSPVSLNTKETGKRHAVLIDTDSGDVSSLSLPTFYHDTFSETLRPGDEEDVLERLSSWVADREDDDCELEIMVDGFIEQDEESFSEAVTEAAEPFSVRNEARSVSHVLDHPLYQRFVDELDADDEDAEMVKQRVIQVLSDLMAQNKIQRS